MYSPRWSRGLRQGDIVGPVFFPVLNNEFTVVKTTRSLAGGDEGKPDLVQLAAKNEYLVVVSHDCEFNTDKRNKVLVARLENVPGNVTGDDLIALRESNNIYSREGQTIAGVNAFVYQPLEGHFAVEQVAAFTTITPLPMKMYDELLSLKRAELLHEHRVFFRQKLGWFFSREADDVDDSEKTPAPDSP